MLFSICKVCEPHKRRLLTRKWNIKVCKKDSVGNVLFQDTLTTQSEMCYKCARNIKKMLNG